MALNQKQKEMIQTAKEALDKMEVLKARKQVGALLPAEVKDYEKYKQFKYGEIWGYISALSELATEKQAEEINAEMQNYIDKIPTV